MSDSLASLQPVDVQIDNILLKKTFLEHLNYIFYGKHHLLDFFKEIETMATLTVLKQAISEAITDTEKQIDELGDTFALIGEKHSKINTLGIKALTLEAYIAAIKEGKTPLEKDVFILFYLQQIEGIEITYFKVLKNLARAIGYSSVFLDEPLDMAIENKILFEYIYKEYIN